MGIEGFVYLTLVLKSTQQQLRDSISQHPNCNRLLTDIYPQYLPLRFETIKAKSKLVSAPTRRHHLDPHLRFLNPPFNFVLFTEPFPTCVITHR